MNANLLQENNRSVNRNLSREEKKEYYIRWKESGINQFDFCKANGISKSALYQWGKELELEKEENHFLPITLEEPPVAKQDRMLALTMTISNQIQLNMQLSEDRLVSFIRELCDGTAIIR